MIEQYDSRLSSSGKLAAAIGASDTTLNLDSVPSALAIGTYRFRLDAEILTGEYHAVGAAFGNLRRGLEGTTAAAHRASVTAHHVITGESLNALRSGAVTLAIAATQLTVPPAFGRSVAERLFLASNF